MSQRKILVDSNSYFRLAKSVHPLLFQEFGKDSNCLYIISDLNHEYARSTRLKSKFPWVNESEFQSNRQHCLPLEKGQDKEIGQAYDFIWGHIETDAPGPSQIDAMHLAHAYVLEIPVVTDDRDMRSVAGEFGISTITTLELLRLMVDENHIVVAKVKEMVGFWTYLGDLPADFHADYKKLFPELQEPSASGANKLRQTEPPPKRPKK